MTPEARLTRIENAIQSLTETQARHDTLMEKQNAGIRDLIVVSRTLMDTVTGLSDSVTGLSGSVAGLSEAQKHTDEKLNALIESIMDLREGQKLTDERLTALIATVDRFLRGLQSGNGA